MLELSYRFQTFRDYSLSSCTLKNLKSETTLESFPKSPYVHSKHNFFLAILMSKLPIDFKLGIMIPNTVRYNVESIATR